jgi:hypothetical protein
MFIIIKFLGKFSKIFFKEDYYLYLDGEVNILSNILNDLYIKFPNLKARKFICCINDNYVTVENTAVFHEDTISIISYLNDSI